MLDSRTLGKLLVVPLPPIPGALRCVLVIFSQSKSGVQKKDHSLSPKFLILVAKNEIVAICKKPELIKYIDIADA